MTFISNFIKKEVAGVPLSFSENEGVWKSVRGLSLQDGALLSVLLRLGRLSWELPCPPPDTGMSLKICRAERKFKSAWKCQSATMTGWVSPQKQNRLTCCKWCWEDMTPQMCLVIKLQLQFFFLHWKSYSFLHTNTVWQLWICYQWLSGSQRYKEGLYDSYTPFQVWSHTFTLCDKQTDIKVLHWTPPLHQTPQISFPHEYEHESRSGFNIKCYWKIKWFSFFLQHSMFKYAVEKLYCDSTVNLATQVSVKVWRSRRSNSPFWIWTSVPISTTSCQNYIVHRFYSSFVFHICCSQCFMGFFFTFIDRN